MTKFHDPMGAPDLKLAGLHLWIQGRQFPSMQDYWDSNWLNTHALVEAPGAMVEANGPFLRTDELASFAQELDVVYRNMSGEAHLKCIEPILEVKATSGRLGHIEVVIDLTPDHMTQSHHFIFDIDQSYLPSTLRDCWKILERYPIRGRDQ